MKEINKKHVLLSMNNGHVLEGFVDSMEDKFLILFENDNHKVIVRIEDISFARIATQEIYKPEENPEPANLPAESGEYSMPLPKPADGPYVKPEFLRRSTR